MNCIYRVIYVIVTWIPINQVGYPEGFSWPIKETKIYEMPSYQAAYNKASQDSAMLLRLQPGVWNMMLDIRVDSIHEP